MPLPNTPALALWQPPQNGLGACQYVAWPELVRTDIHDSPETALAAAAKLYPGLDVLLIQTNLALPQGFLSRMLAGWRQHKNVEVLSPLGREQGLPVPAVSAKDIDALQFLYGEHSIKPATHWARHGSIWRSAALAEVWVSKQRSIAQLNFAVIHGVYVSNEFVKSNPDKNFIGDGKPVLLHVLHSWGGGVEYFARDLRAGDDARHHLFFKAISLDSLPPYGKQLALYHSGSEAPIQVWRLDCPIDDTAIQSDEVQKILREIIGRWGVGAIIVSSLIGHSMDVLKTGLPTIFACHDAYPFWPLLHDTRDAEEADFSIEYLDKSLNEDPYATSFEPHPVEYWLAIKNHLSETILNRHIPCVAPSEYAKKRVCIIEKKLSHADWRIIPHGTINLDRMDRRKVPVQTQKLRVLVPGHLNGDKGERLLLELLLDLPPNIELVLLGCAAYLQYKFQHEAVTCYPEYKREDLSAWVEKIQPDIALLPSLVPETFGYVLSEMLAVGVQVLCANIGAYGERAKTLNSVVTVAPNAKAFIEKLQYFRDFRAELEKLAISSPPPISTLADMAGAWVAISHGRAPDWFFNYLAYDQILEESAIDRKIDLLIEMSIKPSNLHDGQQQKTTDNIDQLPIHQQSGDPVEKPRVEFTRLDQPLLETVGESDEGLIVMSELKFALLQQQKDFQEETISLHKLQARQNKISAALTEASQKKIGESVALLKSKIQQLECLYKMELDNKNSSIGLLNQQLQQATQELHAVYGSTSWKLTAIFRNVKTWFLK